MEQDIRWKQRFNNLKKAFQLLKEAVEIESYSDLEREGLIQRFEYTYELAWNTIKDFLENQGYTNITGSKDTVKQAFQSGLITDGEKWMDVINSRQLTTHTYNEEIAEEIAENIRKVYYNLFRELIDRLDKEIGEKE